MTNTLIGYARCSTDKQDLTAQQEALLKLGVAPDRNYTDRGFTGTNRARPGLDQALAAVRSGDTLVMPAFAPRPDDRTTENLQLGTPGGEVSFGLAIHAIEPIRCKASTGSLA